MAILPRRLAGSASSSARHQEHDCGNSLTLESVHRIWTDALSITPSSPSQSLFEIQRLLCRFQYLPKPLLTNVQLAPLYISFGLILAYLGEHFIALESFQKAVDLDETSAIGWHALGGMKFILGKWKDAGKAWVKCEKCFDSLHQHVIIYRVWKIGGVGADTQEVKLEQDWKLEKSMVEWNLKFAASKSGWQKQYLQEKLWAVNGVPAGIVFGPSFSLVAKNLHHGQKCIGTVRASPLEAKPRTSPQVSINDLLTCRITSSRALNSTKPLPALPVSTLSTLLPIERPQKGISVSSWLIAKGRALSPGKSDLSKARRTENQPAASSTQDLKASRPAKQGHSRKHSGSKSGGLFSGRFRLIDSSDSGTRSDPSDGGFNTETETESDEEGYYLPTDPKPATVASSVPATSTSLPRLTTSSGQLHYPSLPETRRQDASISRHGRKPSRIETIIEEAEEQWSMIPTNSSPASTTPTPAPSYPPRTSSCMPLQPRRKKVVNFEDEVGKPDEVKSVLPEPPNQPANAQSVFPRPEISQNISTEPPKQDVGIQAEVPKRNRIENILLEARKRQEIGIRAEPRKPNRIEKILFEARNQTVDSHAVVRNPSQTNVKVEDNERTMVAPKIFGENSRNGITIEEGVKMEIKVKVEGEGTESKEMEDEEFEARGRSAKRIFVTERPHRAEKSYVPAKRNREPVESKVIKMEEDEAVKVEEKSGADTVKAETTTFEEIAKAEIGKWVETANFQEIVKAEIAKLIGAGKLEEVAKVRPAKVQPAKAQPAKRETVQIQEIAKAEIAKVIGAEKFATAQSAKAQPAKLETVQIQEIAKAEIAKVIGAGKLATVQSAKAKPAKLETVQMQKIAQAEIAKLVAATKLAEIAKAQQQPAKENSARRETVHIQEIAKAEIFKWAQTAKLKPAAKRDTVKSKIAKWEADAVDQSEASPQGQQPATKMTSPKPTGARKPSSSSSSSSSSYSSKSLIEPEIELLQPVRFQGFNGEWRVLDLIYEDQKKAAERCRS